MLFSGKIIITCGILVLSVFVGLLIRIYLEEPQLKSEKTLAPIQPSVKLPETPSSFEKPTKSKELSVPVLPIPKPDFEIISKIKSLPSATIPFFENINKAAKTVEKSLVPDNAPPQKISMKTSEGIILSLTENQFHFLYPNYFIASLIDAQNLFIKEYNPTYEPLSKIETDAQVRLVEEKIVATLLSTNIITEERAEQFVTTIRFTLPELQLIDLKNHYSYGIYESLLFSEFLNAALGKTEAPRKAPKRLFLAGLVKELTDALAHKAQAAVCGTCSSLPLCFQVGASSPGVPGLELFYPSCFCTGCLTSLGCLSANTGQAAIYDQTTGICGVGL